ncbi:transcriptional regulator [Pseudomonas aeruginosa]|nr:transcriptional regulator [Pseudomonas aeruginosa]
MPEKEEAGTVRSVERALALLDLLGQHRALGLEELHYLSGLPKATVSRLLHTLLEQGWLYRALTDRRYRLRSNRLYGDAAERFRCQVVERSAPLLVELSERTGLVADLSILDGDHLLVAESSVPGVLRKRYPRPTGWWSASMPACSTRRWARLCLGELEDSEVRRLARQHQVDEDLWLRTREQAHGQGYGERTEGHWEYPVRLPFLIRAVALPVRVQGRLLGSVALHWPCDQDCVERVRRAAPGNPGRDHQSVAARAGLRRGFACSPAPGLRWRRTHREPACTS